MSDTKPYRLRIPPTSPRAHHVVGSTTYSRENGWYPISEGQRAELQIVKLYDTNLSSPPLFQIVTTEEAVAIEREEGRSRRGSARNPINPATGLPYEDDELENLTAALAEQKARSERVLAQNERVLAQNEELNSKLTSVLGALSGLIPKEQFAQLGLAAPEPRQDPLVDAKPPASGADTNGQRSAPATDGKPTRPGQRGAPPGDKKLAPLGDKKPAEGPPGDESKPPVQGLDGNAADPLGSRGAIEAHDAALKEGGVTTNR